MAAEKRIRRTPEDARKVILDAAEQVMARTGPEGLRLQEVAHAAGVSHPAILHHFESREGLIRALNRRTLESLGEVLRVQMQAPGGGAVLRAAFAAYRGGFAQRVVWLMQSGEFGVGQQVGLGLIDEMAGRLHALRCQQASPGQAPELADSQAIVHLITVAAFGDALIGRRLRRAADEAEEIRKRTDFEDWLGALIGDHVEPGRT